MTYKQLIRFIQPDPAAFDRLAPLFILWLGFDIGSKHLITALIGFLPLLENTAEAIRHQLPEHLELFQLIGAIRLQTVLYLKRPLGRLTLPEDVAGAVLFCLSDWSRFIIDQTLTVDGGLPMR